MKHGGWTIEGSGTCTYNYTSKANMQSLNLTTSLQTLSYHAEKIKVR